MEEIKELWNSNDGFRNAASDFLIPAAHEAYVRERMAIPAEAPKEDYLRKLRQAAYEVFLKSKIGFHDHLDQRIEKTHFRWENPEHSDHNWNHSRIVIKLLNDSFLYNRFLYGEGMEFDMGRAAAYLAADTHDLFQLERKQKEEHPILGALICAVGARYYLQKAKELIATKNVSAQNAVNTFNEKTILAAANMVAYHNGIGKVIKDNFQPLSFADIYRQAVSAAKNLLKDSRFRGRMESNREKLPELQEIDSLEDIDALCAVCPTFENYRDDLGHWKEIAEPTFSNPEKQKLALFAVAFRAADEDATNWPPVYSLLRTIVTYDRPIFTPPEGWDMAMIGRASTDDGIMAELIKSIWPEIGSNGSDIYRILGEILESPEYFNQLGESYMRFHFLRQWQRLEAAASFFPSLADYDIDQVREEVHIVYLKFFYELGIKEGPPPAEIE
ncbi:hypothetical protein FJY90_08230, partial [Candidatus Gottesmanbacteria bacterium]|nr:hypothetical protein [Candidatus Gottesmanbacteria bacterium]